jgi:hypothetical protein
MNPEDCDCETCIRFRDMKAMEQPATYPIFITGIGWLTEKQARAYLNKDVIEELDRLSKLEHDTSNDPANTYGYKTEHMGKRDAYVRAIQIIKNGVNK